MFLDYNKLLYVLYVTKHQDKALLSLDLHVNKRIELSSADTTMCYFQICRNSVSFDAATFEPVSAYAMVA